MPAGYKIPAHQHPHSECVTVIPGELNFGTGDKLDENSTQRLGPGGFVDLPGNINHFVFTTVEAVVQISAGALQHQVREPCR
jgi:quercetin dioxygenase-like cupin family protein